MTTRSVDQLSDEEFFRALDRLDAFLAQQGQPLLIEAEPAQSDDAEKWARRIELETSLAKFFRAAWPHFDPAPYTHGWHIDAIAEHLEA
jgi:hypothetical protein